MIQGWTFLVLSLQLECVSGRDDMEQWKIGAADVLATAREDVLTVNYQPLEKRLHEMNDVLAVRLIVKR